MKSDSPEIAAQCEPDEQICWQAVLERDKRFDGVFVYGVRSTLVFCRPSCPARRPNREQARFFASPEEATKAGFRPCKRCRPERFLSPDLERVRQVCRLIKTEFGNSPTLSDLSKELGGSPFHLQRVFKRATGITPREYANAVRLGRIKDGLRSGESALSAGCDAGCASARGLYERAAAELGMTPATYGRGGKGAQINYCVVPCRLGFLLVAATAAGVCSVSLGDSPAMLESSLKKEFHGADAREDEICLREIVESVLNLLDGRTPQPDLPLDVQATAFQRRVWQELQRINYGETRSYSQVAHAIGKPNAARAVARACAANPIAIAVPCHRVVREDGGLGGYRWGLERKRELLAREKRNKKL